MRRSAQNLSLHQAMKHLLALLILVGCSTQPKRVMLLAAQSTEPPTLTLSLDAVALSIAATNGHYTAVYYPPPGDTNIWIPEWSTNLTDWNYKACQTFYENRTRMIEGDLWITPFYLRVRRQTGPMSATFTHETLVPLFAPRALQDLRKGGVVQ